MKILLKVFAPFLPHVTEEIYSCMFGEAFVNQQSMWPNISDLYEQEEYILLGDNFVNILDFVRKIKSEKQLSVSSPIATLSICNNKQQLDITKIEDDLRNVTKAIQISVNNLDNMLYTEDELFKIQLSF